MEVVQRHSTGSRRHPATLFVLKCGCTYVKPGTHLDEHIPCPNCERRLETKPKPRKPKWPPIFNPY